MLILYGHLIDKGVLSIWRKFSSERSESNIRRLTYKKLNLPTLVYRRRGGSMIETFKIVHGLYSTDYTFKFLFVS
jgi:hypothetical protein